MESPFTHNSIATGSDFLSRKKDVCRLVSLISDGRHAVIYEPPRTGKHSLISMAMSKLTANPGYMFLNANLLNIIDASDFISWMEHISSTSSGRRTVVCIEEFQNILRLENWERLIHMMETELKKDSSPVLILSGFGVNAMKYIFEEKKMVYRLFERVCLSPIDEKSVSDHIIKTFLRVGRVVEPEHTEYIYNIADGHPWYIWQLANSCFNLTKGYLNKSLIDEAVDSLLYTHGLRYQEITEGLSRYQLYLLRAVFDGVTKVSSSEVISQYRLNSSANVHRLKEALTKKEVIVFDSNDVPRIIDPIFKLWLEKHFFKSNQ